ncbi:hypothetical protein AJ81_04735 [Pseudothermotoga hypogea DSM 11164 = NBRC 106472]|uniref:Uncharacterized protein n=1 Tax=Pseudothermotoga hypogea DSM 11164 = NBRC 106472 TaxID=1123384 RepID=A0A0X1KU51_9THEM|nr:hypothetical protein AJ81_04735 [Pseudothermotoga hypogea DSM 11164 = NBRC 106472]
MRNRVVGKIDFIRWSVHGENVALTYSFVCEGRKTEEVIFVRSTAVLVLVAALTLLLLALSSCAKWILIVVDGKVYPIEVEETSNASELKDPTNQDFMELANWCAEQEDVVMFWYDLADPPVGFHDRATLFVGATDVIDKNVYVNNVFIANYEDTAIDEIISIISEQPREDFPGELKLRLVATDLSATVYDLFVDEVKAKDATAKYVLVEFEEVQSNVYKVTKVQVSENFENMDVPKNIPASELNTKGFAFFKIRDGEVVDNRVIEPLKKVQR